MSTSTLFSLYLPFYAQGEAALDAFTTYFARQGQLGPLKTQRGYEVSTFVQETSCGVSAELILEYDDEGFNDGATFTVELNPPEGEVHRSAEFLSHLQGALKGDAAEALKASFMALGSESMTKVYGLARCLVLTDVGELEVLERTNQGLVCRRFENLGEDEAPLEHGTIMLPFSCAPVS